jgi:hypothetical protein
MPSLTPLLPFKLPFLRFNHPLHTFAHGSVSFDLYNNATEETIAYTGTSGQAWDLLYGTWCMVEMAL